MKQLIFSLFLFLICNISFASDTADIDITIPPIHFEFYEHNYSESIQSLGDSLSLIVIDHINSNFDQMTITSFSNNEEITKTWCNHFLPEMIRTVELHFDDKSMDSLIRNGFPDYTNDLAKYVVIKVVSSYSRFSCGWY